MLFPIFVGVSFKLVGKIFLPVQVEKEAPFLFKFVSLADDRKFKRLVFDNDIFLFSPGPYFYNDVERVDNIHYKNAEVNTDDV